MINLYACTNYESSAEEQSRASFVTLPAVT